MTAKRLYRTCPKCGCAKLSIAAGSCLQCGYVKPVSVKIQLPPRHPVAFGITYWGPLPGTSSMYVQWDGPGSGLYLYPCDPSAATSPGMRIRHEGAAGTYDTLRQAEHALAAFIAAGTS